MTETVTIEVDMDKACSKCRRKGALKSGLCLKCIANNIGRAKAMGREYAESERIKDIAERVIGQHHPHLKTAQIAYVMKERDPEAEPKPPKALREGKQRKIAKARLVPQLYHLLTGYDFIIEADEILWDLLSLEQQEALVDHELCFPATTSVAGPEINAGIRRWYSGKLIQIRTASGDLLAGTPNHPILSDRGWIALAFLNEGDRVIRCGDPQRVASFMDPDKHQAPTAIEQIVSSLDMTTFGLMPKTPQNFDTDAIRASQIQIVPTYRNLLSHIRHAHFFKPFLELFFGRGSGITMGISSLRHAGQSLFRMMAPLPIAVGVASHCPPFFGRSILHAIYLSRLPSPNLDSTDSEFSIKASATHARALFDRIRRGPGDISADAIVEINRSNFRGHVYNLQTKGSWYIANNIITHNCHCVRDEKGWYVRDHDVQEFSEILERHGLYHHKLSEFISAAHQRKLPFETAVNQ